MEDWVRRALERWPNVPHLYGWLGLDRRGRWLIRGEIISRPQIIDTINRNYAADERGCWYFQNGPQRGYVQLQNAPLVAWLRPDRGSLETHTGLPIERIEQAYLDEEGGVLLATEHGPAAPSDAELEWIFERLRAGEEPLDEERLARILALPSGADAGLVLELGARPVPVLRLDRAEAPAQLGFVRDPQPPSG